MDAIDEFLDPEKVVQFTNACGHVLRAATSAMRRDKFGGDMARVVMLNEMIRVLDLATVSASRQTLLIDALEASFQAFNPTVVYIPLSTAFGR